MKLLLVMCFAIIFVGLIMAVAFSGNITDRGEKIFTASLVVTITSMGAFLTTALAYILWKGL